MRAIGAARVTLLMNAQQMRLRPRSAHFHVAESGSAMFGLNTSYPPEGGNFARAAREEKIFEEINREQRRICAVRTLCVPYMQSVAAPGPNFRRFDLARTG